MAETVRVTIPGSRAVGAPRKHLARVPSSALPASFRNILLNGGGVSAVDVAENPLVAVSNMIRMVAEGFPLGPGDLLGDVYVELTVSSNDTVVFLTADANIPSAMQDVWGEGITWVNGVDISGSGWDLGEAVSTTHITNSGYETLDKPVKVWNVPEGLDSGSVWGLSCRYFRSEFASQRALPLLVSFLYDGLRMSGVEVWTSSGRHGHLIANNDEQIFIPNITRVSGVAFPITGFHDVDLVSTGSTLKLYVDKVLVGQKPSVWHNLNWTTTGNGACNITEGYYTNSNRDQAYLKALYTRFWRG